MLLVESPRLWKLRNAKKAYLLYRRMTSSTPPRPPPPPRTSRFFAATLKEKDLPAGSTISHQYLLRAGFIRQSSSGVFTLLPIALRSLRKLENIVDEEMENSGCQKLALPSLLNAEPWRTTGRWDTAGPELFRLKDRREADYCLSPTHEEEITNLIAREVESYRQLPIRLYQIGRKYRDERQPKMGLLRAREFIMKDLYTFDGDLTAAESTYNEIVETYKRILGRIGVPYRIAEADSGKIGGTKSHEFHITSTVGEDSLIFCSGCGYTANEERAVGFLPPKVTDSTETTCENISQAKSEIDLSFRAFARSCPDVIPAELRGHLLNPENRIHVGLLSYTHRKKFKHALQFKNLAIAVTANHRTINEVKFGKAVSASYDSENVNEFTLIDSEDDAAMQNITDLLMGNNELRYFIDESSRMDPSENHSVDASASDTPVGQNFQRIYDGLCTISSHKQDKQQDEFNNTTTNLGHKDFRNAQAGDGCPNCKTPLSESSAIEVGHTFLLGEKYSTPLNAIYTPSTTNVPHPTKPGSFLVRHEKPRPLSMGCYGLGISRLLAAVVESSHDDLGIVWPTSMAPYLVCIVPLVRPSKSNEVDPVVTATYDIYRELSSVPYLRGEIVVDDRYAEYAPGHRMRDGLLVGYPWMIVIGKSWGVNQTVELQPRKDKGKVKLMLTLKELKEFFENASSAHR